MSLSLIKSNAFTLSVNKIIEMITPEIRGSSFVVLFVKLEERLTRC